MLQLSLNHKISTQDHQRNYDGQRYYGCIRTVSSIGIPVVVIIAIIVVVIVVTSSVCGD